MKVEICVNDYAPAHMRWGAYIEERADEGIRAYGSDPDMALHELLTRIDPASPDSEREFYWVLRAIADRKIAKLPEGEKAAFNDGFMTAYAALTEALGLV